MHVVRTAFYCQPETLEALKAQAALEHRTVSNLVDCVMLRYLREKEAELAAKEIK